MVVRGGGPAQCRVGDEVRVEWVAGKDIRFEVHTCGDPHSDKLALLLHGFPEHAFTWRHQMPLLARLGYKVWAPNQRGYGATTRPRERGAYHIDKLLADVGDLIDAAACSEVLLIGHDWGGFVAWYTALRKIRPLTRLVILNAPHPARAKRALQTSWKQRMRSLYVPYFLLPWLPEFLLGLGRARGVAQMISYVAVDRRRFPESVLDVYRDNASRPGALTAMIDWYRANTRMFVDAETLPLLDLPVLMIWGEQDLALELELTSGMDELASNLTLHTLPGVSHWVQQEAPEEVGRILEAWLTGVATSGQCH